MLHGEAKKKKRKSKHNLYKRVVQNTCLGCFLFYSRLQGEVKSWGQHFSPSQTLFVLDVSAALTQSCPTLCDAMNCSSSGSQFSRRESWSGLLCPSPGIFPSRDRTQVSRIVGRFFFFFFLLSELPVKPVNTGVGSLSHLQGIFPSQELNRDRLHCR